ncbi:MAG TPA: protein kinase [Kofleriaceae bacterium]|jgi:serine/threonine-protein kinase
MANFLSKGDTVAKTGDIIEGRYRIIKTLGAGGMGTVFLAEHALIKRRVAIKILHAELATDANVVDRFMNEARAAGTLGHPNIVESTDMGFTHDHVPYIVFEYLEGSLLTDEIYRVGGLPVRRTVRICAQIASALHAAHNAGIVHRDLKSDNVFLTDKDEQSDHAKVLDFGISRFMETEDRQKGMVMGTPEFMAPEQITDPENVDARADIYALGVIMYEMLTARRPFSNEDDPQQLLYRIVHEAPPPLMRPEVPHGLAEIILDKMMAKDPADRYQSMADVEAALETFMTRGDGTPLPIRRTQSVPVAVDARQSSSIPRPVRSANTPRPGSIMPLTAKRPYALYAMAGGGVMVGVIGLVVALHSSSHETVAAHQPQVQQPLPAAAMPAPREAEKIPVELEADVPGAKITFRRRVAIAPETVQISPMDVVELVEVSAPGYKTQRFWLTFDRPTHLRAHLARGAGIAEATEEETLVALGEIAAPKPTAPSIVKVAPAAAPQAAPMPAAVVATTTKAPAVAMVMAPRKIGHVSDNADVQIEAQAADQPAAPTAEQAITAPAGPTADPSIAAIDIPKAPAPPVIDAATLSSVVGSHRVEVLKCFAAGKSKDHAMKGTVTLQMDVAETGHVHHIQIQSTLKDPLVAACIVKAASLWSFPGHTGGDANVAYPFTFN